jgi:tRNA threonylcarbamoyladenosine biosynthesis protein TsaE
MRETITIRLNEAKKTTSCGSSLARSLYALPVDILLTGELGAGKTTFLQGFAQGLGIPGPVTSPTYALEQRYKTADGRPFIHIDLYRLSPQHAAQLLAQTDDHNGIRCIEWADRMTAPASHPSIKIHCAHEGNGRSVSITFDDIPVPTGTQIDQWRKDARLPAHIIAHCETVARVAITCAKELIERGLIVRLKAAEASAKVHDLLRFVDFYRQDSGPHQQTSTDDEEAWSSIAKRYPGMNHESASAEFVREKGFSAVADMGLLHGLRNPIESRKTVEQKLVYYADKRVSFDRIVTLDERFNDLRERYSAGQKTIENEQWLADGKITEKELFPDGPPL